ncbi:MAG: hypothetical protein JSS07_01715 [Proteobacteria bacterium]|nr:hypothetical protein [Pseudomonadota bacterium]
MKRLVILSGVLLCSAAMADNCPEAASVFDHATKDGIGAQWKTNNDKLNWYLDNFSNNNKPPATIASKFTFMQANYENNQLTCYYQWPTEDGKTTNWLSVRLKTTQKLKLEWTGGACSNFEAPNCQFSLIDDGAAPASTNNAPPAATTSPSEGIKK